MTTKCTQCGHPEEDHLGYWSDGTIIPGAYCYYEENQGHSEDLCSCTGFNTNPDVSTYLDVLIAKAGT